MSLWERNIIHETNRKLPPVVGLKVLKSYVNNIVLKIDGIERKKESNLTMLLDLFQKNIR